MKKYFALTTLALASLCITSCEDDDTTFNPELPTEVVAPATYTFERNGENTVNFSGQTTRILMAEELIDATLDFDNTTTQLLLDMYANENTPFSTAALNDSDKSIKSKVAASQDYFSTNASASASIKQYFETLMTAQVETVFPQEMVAAAPGVAGQIADGSSTRYVNEKGLEYNQALAKGLIGALMVDQALNNYLGEAVLDAGTNVEDNDNDIVSEGTPYTSMEHKWDEAYGYAFGTSVDITNPVPTIGEDDSFLNKYIGRVEEDADFAGIAENIFEAYKLGRAAITEKNYIVRDEQAEVLRELISEVVGIRAVYYLQQGKNAIEANDYGAAFHDLSEGVGFIYSLQFTRNPLTDAPYFSGEEVQAFIDTLMAGNGFWDINQAALDTMSETIAEPFTFTVAQAGSTN